MQKLLIGVSALLLAGTASAAVTIVNKASYPTGPAAGETLVVTFDLPPAPGFTVTGTAGTYLGSAGLQSGVAAPLPGNPSLYMSVRQPESATLTSLAGLKTLSLDVGSVDASNLITFKGPMGFSQSFTGTQLAAPSAANGAQSGIGTNFRVYFDLGNHGVNEVVFTSGVNSFEFDNIAANAVPEPSTWAMLIAGFGLVGMASRRRGRMAMATA